MIEAIRIAWPANSETSIDRKTPFDLRAFIETRRRTDPCDCPDTRIPV